MAPPFVSRPVTRRQFLGAASALAGAAAFPTIVPAAALGAEGATAPSQRIGVGLIGVGCMGRGHLRRMLGDAGVQVRAVCDVDRTRRDEAQRVAHEQYATERQLGAYQDCAAINDYRELLARPDIDAVVIATPDHWHSIQSIDAAKAGKDIYCEKPISITIQEGRRVVEAVRRYGRVFQTGTQYRSVPTLRQVCGFVRGGGMGDVRAVFTNMGTIGGHLRSGRCQPYVSVLSPDVMGRSYPPLDFALPGEPVPEGLDWDLWVGPAPWKPFNHLYHENPIPGVVPWSFCEDFGVTALTGYLAHAADVLQFALGMETSGPVELIHPNDSQYPTLTCRYASGTLLHFVDHWGMVKSHYHAVPDNARLEGNFGGVLVSDRGWLTTMSTGGPVEGTPALIEEIGLPTRDVNLGQNNHHANWLECIRTREMPSSHEEIGHRSASLGHLANIACKLERSLQWDPVAETFTDETANRLRARATRPPWRV